jgi:uncharacterized MAPEG superfamily protein
MELIYLVTALMLLEYFVFTLLVGVARGKTGIDAPAMTGAPELERAVRVQLNTLEQLIVVIPAMFLFAMFVHVQVAAGLGVLFIIARILYARGYLADPGKRSLGFGLGFLATLVLLLGSVYGTLMAII